MTLNGRISYHSLKQHAKDNPGVNVPDLLCLASKNDPYYMGSKAQVVKGEWFARVWREFGYSSGVHLRRIHYRLDAQKQPILMPNGLPYENTQKCWTFLTEASKCARYLKTVDVSAFVDKRNKSNTINRTYHYWEQEDTPDYELADSDDFEISMPEWPELPDFNTNGYNAVQPYHIEIWIEKSTMDDILKPICFDYDCNLIVGTGEMSITSVVELIKRVKEADRPAIILYLADFDPAGFGMSCSVARKIEYFLQEMGLDLDITLQPILLNADQIAQYSLPPKPFAKEQAAARAANLGAFTDHACELDALEALHPGALARIVKAAILRYFDPKLRSDTWRQRSKLEQELTASRQEVIDRHSDELDELHSIFDQAVSDFQEMTVDLTERMPELLADIRGELEAVDLDMDDYKLPEPKEADEFYDPLFASWRDYLSQLQAYKLYKNGG